MGADVAGAAGHEDCHPVSLPDCRPAAGTLSTCTILRGFGNGPVELEDRSVYSMALVLRVPALRAHNTTLGMNVPGVQTTYTSHLGTFRRHRADQYPDLTLLAVQAVHVKAYMLALAARDIAPAIRSSALFALRSFCEYLRSEELVPLNPTLGMKVPGARKLRTEIYTDAEADLVLAWEGDQPGKRGRVGFAVLAMLRWTGLRRNEVSMLHLDQVDLDARRISVVGKGTRPASCPSLPRSFRSSTTI